ncbi:hypothetical protein VIGAN_11074800, partial [Vigna angularis var. angularis]
LIHAITTFLPSFQNKLNITIIDDNQVLHNNKVHLKEHFLAFKACIDGFLFCKPLVLVDGTLLNGKYMDTFLAAIAQDRKNNII